MTRSCQPVGVVQCFEYLVRLFVEAMGSGVISSKSSEVAEPEERDAEAAMVAKLSADHQCFLEVRLRDHTLALRHRQLPNRGQHLHAGRPYRCGAVLRHG